jgi:tetratricopeptide (TPR) repeat protein/S1-C subfamily serine protease
MKTTSLLLSTLLITHTASAFAAPQTNVNPVLKNQVAPADELPSPQEVQQTAKKITVRITSEKNGGSGVLIAKKGSTYLVLTNAHVARRATQFQIQAPDGQKYSAAKFDGGFDNKYDLALLKFTSNKVYKLADLTDVASPLAPGRTIYSTGFPFDAKDMRITSGEVTQLSDIPFDDGTQIGYTINKGEKGIRQGMSGGAILDGRGKFLGINTLVAAPISSNYTYNDGSKPLPKLLARYRQANWAIPVYNFLTKVKPDILYGYEGLPKVEQQVIPTGYLAKLNNQARRISVRIEAGNSNGSGVVIAKEGNSYYVLTAKHVIQNPETNQNFADTKIITFDQDRHNVTSTVVATGADLAVIKFSSNNDYPLAQLGNYSPNDGSLVLAAGFPGREKINSPLWQWQLNPGFVNDPEQGKFEAQNNLSFSNGYDLLYSSISYGGMSGGAIFDTSGKVVGIHGRAESTDRAILGKSLGISTQTFTGLLPKLQIKPQLLKISKNNPVDLKQQELSAITLAMQSIAQPSVSSSGESWLAYANQLYRTRQYNKSIAAFDIAISKGEILKGNYGKAISLNEVGKLEFAKVAIAKAIMVVPVKRRTDYYYFWKIQSVIFRKLEQADKALEAIDTAIRLEPNDWTIRSEKASLLTDKRKFTAAITIFSEIIAKKPEASAYNNRGLAKFNSGNKTGAIADYNQSLSINPNYIIVYKNRGIAKSSLNNHTGALADFNQALTINPRDNIAHALRGMAKLQLGDKAGSIADFNQAVTINPKNANAYALRGIAKFQLADQAGAMKDFNQALSINPRHAEAYFGRGAVKVFVGNRSEGIKDIQKAAEISFKQGKMEQYKQYQLLVKTIQSRK